MSVKTIIIVECGTVKAVLSTARPDKHKIKVLDLDWAELESADEKNDMRGRIDEISGSSKYHKILLA